jgi:RimJ/RimL family protein N-acetyltransferase
VLREFADDDVAVGLALATDPYVQQFSGLPPGATEQHARQWVEDNRQRWATGKGFSFAVADAGTGRGLGQIGLWLDELQYGRATAGYGIAPSARGRGLAADALLALTAFAWTIPGLYRMSLFIEPWNVASLRTAERAGYEREGLLRGYMEIGGSRRDMIIWGALRP